MGHVSEKRYPLNEEDYELHEEVGEGVSATVFRALCIPLNETVAIKVLDLEKCNNDLDGIRREVQTMNLIDHPNVLRAYCSFNAGCKLWVVMPYMAAGSCLHLMKSSRPEGFEEPIIATLLREVLKALVYLHAHGHIHRDVKAGNILIDSNGAVKLADFGVSACMFDTGDRQRSRNTFVGTPCWMAPEVMQQVHGYDFKADIWSFGITALELAHGHAPFSKYPPMKVLLMTLQNAPPGLDYERDKKFSKHFKGMVAACLVKDPRKRPSAEKLLKHSFFSSGCSNEQLSRKVIRGLSPLGDRFRSLKTKEADLLVQNKGIYGDKEHLSQQEYIRGISGWNFNTEDLKAQAALIQDDEGISNVVDLDVNCKQKESFDDQYSETEKPYSARSSQSSITVAQEDDFNDHKTGETSSFTSPVKAFDLDVNVRENDSASTPRGKDAMRSDLKPPNMEIKKSDDDNLERSCSAPNNFGENSAPLLPEIAIKVDGPWGRENVQPKSQPVRNYSGTMLSCPSSNNLTAVDETSEAFVRCKGRFKVTSADLSSKDASFTIPTCSSVSNLATTSIMSSLVYIGQHMDFQKEEYRRLMKIVAPNSETVDVSTNDLPQTSPVSARERTLELQMTSLLQSVEKLAEEFQAVKENNVQMQRQLRKLNSMLIKEEEAKAKEND